MPTREINTTRKAPGKKHRRTRPKIIPRQYIHSLRGKYKGKGLLKALMAEKEREREL